MDAERREEKAMSTRRDPPDAINAEAFSVAELRRMVFEGEGPLATPLALMLLGRKSYPEKATDLERLLMDEAAPPRIRNSAALELGRLGTPDAVAALERGLTLNDDLGLRGVLEALSLVRIERVPAGIDDLIDRGGPVGQAARRTSALIAHRLGIAGPSLANPVPTATNAMEVHAADPKEVETAIAALGKAAPGLRLLREGASMFQCGGPPLMFLPCGDGGDWIDVRRFMYRTAEVGVVAVLNTREFRHWALRYRVVIEPAAGDGIRIVVSTTKGQVVLEGSARIDGQHTTFEIRSVADPGSLSIELDGVVDQGRVRFTAARSSLHRRPSPSPLRLDQDH
jgi:hypothetical protein